MAAARGPMNRTVGPCAHRFVTQVTQMSNSRRLASVGLCLTALATGSCAHIAGKTVGGKEPPNMLVATDGSICIVSEERFEKTEVGMKALCAWRGGSRIPPR